MAQCWLLRLARTSSVSMANSPALDRRQEVQRE
jgi:hypothetical protein